MAFIQTLFDRVAIRPANGTKNEEGLLESAITYEMKREV